LDHGDLTDPAICWTGCRATSIEMAAFGTKAPRRPFPKIGHRITLESLGRRGWQALLTCKRGEVLGTVEAPDLRAAERRAAERFMLTEQQRARLALCEMR
jgi:hypothetical protein